ncbi:MAG: 2-C-methyl-D-erythritol 4-phosphate cytidylyltransferase [Planctomycetota bacterium]
MRLGVIIPAAGRGRRFAKGGAGDKLALELGGHEVGGRRVGGVSVLERSVGLFAGRAEVAAVVLAVPPDEVDVFELRWGDRLRERMVGGELKIVAGGEAERWETVMNAIEALPEGCTHIAVHDAARPLATRALIDRCVAAAERVRAVVPGVRVSATLKRVYEESVEGAERRGEPEGVVFQSVDEILGLEAEDSAGDEAVDDDLSRRVLETVDRRGLWAVQTPQIFSAEVLAGAYRRLRDGEFAAAMITDDASLVERVGGVAVHIVEGEPTNLKITEPGDEAMAEAIVRSREAAKRTEDAAARLFRDDDDDA